VPFSITNCNSHYQRVKSINIPLFTIKSQRPGVLILTIEVYIGSLSQFALVGADSQTSLGFAIPRHVLGITQKIGLSILSSKKKIRQK